MKQAIPTHLITGFLGSGKTTAILNLLAGKPDDETWAVLVNEFGEVGIDGAMMTGKGAVVREVPGGCMCCVAGLPMQIGLNMLIARSNPDRILIEPTGLGHPEQVLKTLTGEYYQEVLDLRATICLVDPRTLQDERYLENASFRDQIAMADVLVASKTDVCTDKDRELFEQFCQSLSPLKAATGWISQGQLDSAWLELPGTVRAATRPGAHRHLIPQSQQSEPELLELPAGKEYIRRENKGQAHFSCGWLFSQSLIFSFNQLFTLFSGINVSRLKAVVQTDQGVRAFNAQDGVLSVLELDDCLDSRVEIIHSSPQDWQQIEQQLLIAKACT